MEEGTRICIFLTQNINLYFYTQLYNYTQGREKTEEISDIITNETVRKEIVTILRKLGSIKYLVLYDFEIFKSYITEIKVAPLKIDSQWDAAAKKKYIATKYFTIVILQKSVAK